MKSHGGLRNQLRAVRTRLGVSQADLAAAAGVTRQTVGGIESDLYAPSAAVALRIAKALGCRMEELFWLDDGAAELDAVTASGTELAPDGRVTLARIAGRWVAHGLQGGAAFRSEMVPADGVTVNSGSKEAVTVRLLDDVENLSRTVVLAGCTPALSLWARSAERWFPGLRVHWVHANSTAALESLARGEVHAAGTHLYDTVTGQSNDGFVRSMLPARRIALVSLGAWEEGLVVQHGNPKRLQSVDDLAQPRVTLINRETGSGSRLLLDGMLQVGGIAPKNLHGYETTETSHHGVASTVASGQADAGVSTEAVARAFGLDFVPLRQVQYDLAFLEEYLEEEPVRQLLGTLHHRWVCTQLAVLGGYEISRTGEIVTIG